MSGHSGRCFRDRRKTAARKARQSGKRREKDKRWASAHQRFKQAPFVQAMAFDAYFGSTRE